MVNNSKLAVGLLDFKFGRRRLDAEGVIVCSVDYHAFSSQSQIEEEDPFADLRGFCQLKYFPTVKTMLIK